MRYAVEFIIDGKHRTILLSANESQILKDVLGRMEIDELKNEAESKLVYRLYEAL